MGAAGRGDLMREQTIINANTESKICGAPKKCPLFVLSRSQAVGEELAGMESVKLYIRLSLICRALGGGLRVGSHPRSSTQSCRQFGRTSQ